MTAKRLFALTLIALLLSSCSGAKSVWAGLSGIPPATLFATVAAALASQLVVIAVILLVYRQTLRRLESRLQTLDGQIRTRDEEIRSRDDELRESEHDREELRTILLDKDPFVAGLHDQPRYLSDADWERLCSLLDQVCNGFCTRLQERWPEMTLAELRTAVLLRYHFSGQQMAAMMGISPASVTKSKQRLKARLGLSDGGSLDEFFASFDI